MNIIKCLLLILVMFSVNVNSLHSQSDGKTISIVPISESKLHACIFNAIRIFARQENPINLEDIDAKLIYHYDLVKDSLVPNYKNIELVALRENEFELRGIDSVGIIEFTIKLNSKVIKERLKVHPLEVHFSIGAKFLPKQEIDVKYFQENFPRMFCNIDFDGLYAKGIIKSYNLTTLSKTTGTFKSKTIDPKNLNEIKDAIANLTSGDQIILSEIVYSAPCWQNKTYEENFIIELK